MSRSLALRGLARRLVRREHPQFRAYLAALAESERWPWERLESAAWAAAEAQAAHALARSPFYRDWARGAGLGAAERVRREGWETLPLISAADVHADARRFLTRPARTCARGVTSGTTGTPRTVYRDLRSVIFEHALLWRQWGWFGITPRDRRVTLRGDRLFPNDHPGPAYWRANPADRQLVMSGYHLGPRTFDAYWAAILRFRPTVVEGYPSMLNALAVLMEARGADPYPVRAVVTSSEQVPPDVERRIAAAFPGPLADRYGQAERVCSLGRCEDGRMHVFPEDGLVELLPVPGADGRAEIVGSAFHNRAFPLLRYRTGDLVRPLGGACPCGRAFPVTSAVEGRISDLVVTTDGRWVWPTRMVVLVPGVAECQIVQYEPGEVLCLMVPDGRFTAATPGALADAVGRDLGPRERVRVEVVERIDRTAHGKLQRIRSYVGLEAAARER